MGKMNSKTISLLSLGLVCALGVLGSMRLANRGYETNAATTQTDRRVYIYLAGAWDNNGHMFIHYWNAGGDVTTWTACPEMTKVVSDYYQGLFYYDLPMTVTGMLVKDVTGNVLKTSNQSDDISFSSFVDGTNFKAAAVQGWVDPDGEGPLNGDNFKRTVTMVDTLPSNSGQIAAILNNINSCTQSYASGYNSWPQINDLFILPSSYDGGTVVVDNFGPVTTITDKCAYLQNRYNIDQAS